MVAWPGHQFVGFDGAAMRTRKDFISEYKILKFFHTGIALILIDRHTIFLLKK